MLVAFVFSLCSFADVPCSWVGSAFALLGMLTTGPTYAQMLGNRGWLRSWFSTSFHEFWGVRRGDSMKASTLYAVVVVSLLCLTFTLSASAREMVLPAGTILKCTLDEPNFSSATAAIGDPCAMPAALAYRVRTAGFPARKLSRRPSRVGAGSRPFLGQGIYEDRV